VTIENSEKSAIESPRRVSLAGIQGHRRTSHFRCATSTSGMRLRIAIRTDVNIAVKDTPAFMAEFGVAAAGQLRHATDSTRSHASEARRIE